MLYITGVFRDKSFIIMWCTFWLIKRCLGTFKYLSYCTLVTWFFYFIFWGYLYFFDQKIFMIFGWRYKGVFQSVWDSVHSASRDSCGKSRGLPRLNLKNHPVNSLRLKFRLFRLEIIRTVFLQDEFSPGKYQLWLIMIWI